MSLADFSEISLDLNPSTTDLRLNEDGVTISRSLLPGGVRVLTEHIPHQHSVTVGLWVGAGSRDEAPHTEGSTHFLEHLLFKGTQRRTAGDIARYTDYLGGGFNAATSKQYTCYHGHVFEEDLAGAVDLLTDMVTSPLLSSTDMEMERGVILEELAMYNDDASDVVAETIPTQVFGTHPLGRPVGGSVETVRSLTHESLLAHYQRNYRPAELVVTAAGAVDHDVLCELIVAALNRGGWELPANTPAAARRQADAIVYAEASNRFMQRNVEQTAVTIGMPSLGLHDIRRPALIMLSIILGGGTSSRLFQEIREKRGLAYSTYSYPANYPEGGLFGLYAACAPTNTAEVARLLGAALDNLAENGVSEEEVESAYRRVRADMVFDGESQASHMNRLGQAELIRGALISHSEQLRRFRAVTPSAIHQLAQELAVAPRSRAIAGPHDI